MPNLLRKFSVESPANPVEQKYVGLKPAPPKSPVKHKPKPKVPPSQDSEVAFSLPQFIFSPTFRWQNYLIQLPTLLLAGISFWISTFILKNILPTTIQNVILPNFYLPFSASVFFGTFFGSWYLSQNLRRSFFLAIIVFGILELRFHQQLQAIWMILLFLPLLLIELLLTYRFFRR